MLCTQVPECPANYRAWVEEMAKYVKRLDPLHLVTIGEEGFFGEEQPEAVHNPQGWGGRSARTLCWTTCQLLSTLPPSTCGPTTGSGERPCASRWS